MNMKKLAQRTRRTPGRLNGEIQQSYYGCNGDGRMVKPIKTPFGPINITVTCPHCLGMGCRAIRHR